MRITVITDDLKIPSIRPTFNEIQDVQAAAEAYLAGEIINHLERLHWPEKSMDESIFEFQADFCKAMGNAVRLKILHTLRERAKTETEIMQETGCNQASVSRHLSVLRSVGVVGSNRHGTTIFYSLTDPKVGEVCDLVRSVLVKHMQHQSQMMK